MLSQHVLGCACGAPFHADELYDEVRSAAPYAALDRETFDRVVDFVATGGYALRTYERYARIRLTSDGKWRIANPRVAQQYRLNVGTIVEMPMLNVRYVTQGSGHGGAGRAGARQDRGIFRRDRCAPGDTFLFAGKVLRFEGIRENECFVSNGAGARMHRADPMPAASFRSRPISPSSVRGMLADPERWRELPEQVATGCGCRRRSRCCRARQTCWSRPFPRGNRHYMVCLSRSRAGWRTRRSACC